MRAKTGAKKGQASRRGRASDGRRPADLDSLVRELIEIGLRVPDSEWEKIPPDYFANLDAYRSGRLPKAK